MKNICKKVAKNLGYILLQYKTAQNKQLLKITNNIPTNVCRCGLLFYARSQAPISIVAGYSGTPT
jgi:hypothetical protein